MARKRVTIDLLATMVANGFQALQEEMREGFRQITSRFDSVEAKLGEHSSVLDEHSHRLDRIERKLDGTVERVDDHSVRLERLEKQQRA
jgi:uncharacterized coiled-coil protein SlyX